MCTLILLRRPDSSWPLVMAANRDEMAGRPWRPPGRHWDDRPEVVAGLDELAGGSWLGVNEHGMAAAMLNRMGTLGPAPGKRSRGELVLEALDHADADDAAQALADLQGLSYRPFNMVVADNRDAFWIRNDGRAITVGAIPPGTHMLTAYDLDDPRSPRVRAYLPRFAALAPPDPAVGAWGDWTALMADPGSRGEGEEDAAMTFTRDNGFGTVSSSLIALPAPASALGPEFKPVWLFASGRPDRVGYDAVPLA